MQSTLKSCCVSHHYPPMSHILLLSQPHLRLSHAMLKELYASQQLEGLQV
uniref:Uncharacterized protein n=1 Tax=Ascaris lumbricoides TaxID=6252 RepID=A0A0M3ITS2_ASCLU